MKRFEERKEMYDPYVKDTSLTLTENILTYLNMNYDFIIKIDSDNNYYGIDEITIHPENNCSYIIIDGDYEVACFFVANGLYTIMSPSDNDFYYTGSTVADFRNDFEDIVDKYDSYIRQETSEQFPLEESCLRRLNEFKMNLATFGIGEDFIEACEKQNITDFKDITSVLKQVFDNKNKKQ